MNRSIPCQPVFWPAHYWRSALPETEDVDESQAAGFSGYRNFINSVVAETEQFPGQVLLVHGDTHLFKVDKPLYSPTKVLANLTRLQTFGSPLIDWVRVTVDEKNANVFTIQPVMVKQRGLAADAVQRDAATLAGSRDRTKSL